MLGSWRVDIGHSAADRDESSQWTRLHDHKHHRSIFGQHHVIYKPESELHSLQQPEPQLPLRATIPPQLLGGFSPKG